jgi:hypothetical protein
MPRGGVIRHLRTGAPYQWYKTWQMGHVCLIDRRGCDAIPRAITPEASMSDNDDHRSKAPSRRSVVKGAAWTMPAIIVAAPAPTIAASAGPLTFTGAACKLPGSSSDAYKGYVFELVATNPGGSGSINTVTVITGVTVNGVIEPTFAVVERGGGGSCSCSSCGSAPTNHQFCTPANTSAQRILLYTDGAASGTSANTEVCLTYVRYKCDCSPLFGTTQPATVCSGRRSTPPLTGGGGACRISDVFPLPA